MNTISESQANVILDLLDREEIDLACHRFLRMIFTENQDFSMAQYESATYKAILCHLYIPTAPRYARVRYVYRAVRLAYT